VACPAALPLWNGTQCIGCLPTEFYDLRNLRCIHARNASNVSALNATGKVVVIGQYSLGFLAAQINASVIPIQICPAALPLYNGTDCISCPPGMYYLIETLSCYLPVYSSNVAALNASGRVLQLGNFTLLALEQKIAAQPYPTKPCPAATPFLSGGVCAACPLGHYYDLMTSRCYKPQYATNTTYLNATGHYIQVGNYTLANLVQALTSSPLPSVACPISAPVFNGTHCVYCPPTDYYFLSNFTCYHPAKVSNISALNASHRYVDYGGITLTILNDAILLQTEPVLPCPASAPMYNGSNCVFCPVGTYYLLSNFTCFTPNFATNISAVAATNRYIQFAPNYTLNSISAAISASPLPLQLCPAAAPLWNGSQC
jgi:hypothetical protein